MQIYVRSLPSSKTTVRGMNQLLTGMDSSTLWEFLNLEGAEILNHYSYDAFGNTIEKTEKVENRFCYNGEMLDPVTQQYYLRARFYNPVIGRFTQEDTYYGDGLNLYQYCQANPVGYVDPSGHNCGTTQSRYNSDEEQHPKAAYDRMREELGLKTKSGYNNSGVGKGKDPWRSYESGTTNNPYAYLEDGPNVGVGKDFTKKQKETMLVENRKRNGGTNSYSNCQIISRKYNREKWNN